MYYRILEQDYVFSSLQFAQTLINITRMLNCPCKSTKFYDIILFYFSCFRKCEICLIFFVVTIKENSLLWTLFYKTKMEINVKKIQSWFKSYSTFSLEWKQVHSSNWKVYLKYLLIAVIYIERDGKA